MAGERKSVTIHYRKFNRPATVPHTLERLVRAAMDSLTEDGVPIRSRYLARLNVVGSDNY